MAVEVNLKAGGPHPSLVGDRLGTTTHTTTQTWSGESNITITDQTFSTPTARAVLVTAGCANITFSYCTFENIASTSGVSGGYSYGLIQLENSSNITFDHCKFENIARAADQQWRNNMMHVDNVNGFNFTNCRVKNVNSDQSQPNYTIGDEGNRCMRIGTGTNQVNVSYSTFDNPGRNFIQFNTGVMTNTTIHHNDVFGTGLNNSEFEDMLSFYNTGGTSLSDMIDVHHNYMSNGGPSISGTAIIMGDGNNTVTTGYINTHDNVIVRPGSVGVGIASGVNQFTQDNLVFADDGSDANSVGLMINNWGVGDGFGQPGCADNTIEDNRVWFYNGTNNNSFWGGFTACENTIVANNTFDDSTLLLANLQDVVAVNASAAVPTGTPMTPYDLSLTDQSFWNDDVYTTESGSLPTGLTMSAAGVVSGTRTGADTVFTYRVTNRVGSWDTATFTTTGFGGVGFETTAPVQDAVDVTTPLTVSGTAPNDGSQDYEVSAVVDGNSPVWNTATYSSGPETWTVDSAITIPQAGETIRVRARRWK